LAVEVRRHLVTIQIVEDGCEGFSSLQDVGRLGAFAVHVDGEAGVVGEERLLPFGVAAVGTVGVCVEQLAQCEPSGGFSRGEFGVNGH
jgi:hypothetical protein